MQSEKRMRKEIEEEVRYEREVEIRELKQKLEVKD